MNKTFLWIMAFISFLTFNTAVFADSSICRENLSKMIQSLNLDDSQKAKIKPIVDQLKSGYKAAGEQMGTLETQISEQVNSANMDQSKLDSLVDAKAKLIADMMKAKLRAKNQIFAALNPQQKEKLQAMMKKVDDKIAAEFKACDQD